MAASVSVRSNSALAEMNVTPLVDVMLVLLIIFMVTAPMLSRPLDVALPSTTPQASPVKPQILSLRVGGAGELHLDDRPMSIAQLKQRLDDALLSDPRTVLTMQADSQADYQQVVTALATVRATGIQQVSWRN